MDKILLKTAYDRADYRFNAILDDIIEVHAEENDEIGDIGGLAYDTLSEYNLTHEEIESICNEKPSYDVMYKFIAFYIHYVEDDDVFNGMTQSTEILHTWILKNLGVDFAKDDIDKLFYEISAITK